MRRLSLYCFVILSTLTSVSYSQAQGVSDYLPYQGFLSDTNGIAITGAVNITIRIYRTETDDIATALTSVTQQTNVQNGSFGIYLNGIKNYFTSGEGQWIGISVGDQPELLPRQRFGSIPYAFLSYNAQRFDGRPAADFVTQEQINNIDAGLNTDDVNDLIDARNYLTEDAITVLINNLIDARNYLTEDAITVLINNLIDARNYLTQAGVDTLIDARNYLDANAVNTLIDTRNYLTEAEVNTLITNATNASNQQIQNLQNQINNLQGGAGLPHVLGTTNHTNNNLVENGKFQYNNFTGLEAAYEMCQDAFPNDSTAHMCSVDEIVYAISSNSVDAIGYDVTGWVFSTAGNRVGASLNNCHSFLYSSGDIASGTTAQLRSNVLSGGGGGGIVGKTVEVNPNVACGGTLPVLCCR
jgi:hypothetical protein